PTAAMRAAMAAADVGDDVYGEDPTINQLERRAAEIFDKEAALFVPTGTMGNTIGIKVHTEHGQEVICESRAHILNYELSMMAWFAGCVARAIAAEDGTLTWKQIREQIRPLGPHAAPTGLIEVENTHNMAGGTVYAQDTLDEICEEAHKLGLPVHMDGARIFNAAAAQATSVGRITKHIDTVMFCLSKALGAPAGSMLVGPRNLIDKGRLYRKRLGGGMRQAGVLGAAGLIALEKMPARLGEDHANARLIAGELNKIDGIRADATPPTNIVFFDVADTGLTAPAFSDELKARGVLINANNARRLRLLTHYDVSRDDCARAVEVIRATAATTAHDPVAR
ncbi:MAG: aminotransferase class I/II-fold pyridoxal phosphate-dependent enzyme, partial [Acidobacteria bacterium]|nr:aminotransferase class I/II-fold pyridoxal phosphate-dependent enzyme [Acidobacteriota bacterium]